MAGLSQFSETQVDRLFEDWDELEPTSKDSKVQSDFGVSTEELFSRYSYYAKLVREKTKWERGNSGPAIDFHSILTENQDSSVDPELKIKIFVQEKLSNGQLLELTQNPTPEKGQRLDKSNNSVVEEVDEFQIPFHVIKKKLFNENTRVPFYKTTVVQSCLPVLIEDIPKIQIQKETFDKFQLFDLKCRLITFFGRICGVKRNERYNQRIGIYDVDDGTGLISVQFNHLKKEFKDCFCEMDRLERSLQLQKRKANPVTGSTTGDLIKLLRLSKVRLNRQINYFNLGDRVLVLGVPFHGDSYRQPRIFSYEMYAHNGADCDFEVYFKDLLFNSYCSKYFMNKSEAKI